jgi:hypothetical protein
MAGVEFSVMGGALWSMDDPLTAFIVRWKVPIGVAEPSLTVTCCEEFALTVRGNGGVVLAPSGKPEIATETDPVKPFAPATETVIAPLEHPCIALMEDGEAEMVKSGGGLFGADGALPGLQLQKTRQATPVPNAETVSFAPSFRTDRPLKI